MKYPVILLIVALLCMRTADAQTLPDASLFLSSDEMRQLEAKRSHDGERAIQDSADLRLDAIMFYAPDNWMLWISGERWTPDTVRRDVKIIGVSEQTVRLMYRLDPTQVFQEISLYPHQTYQAATGTVLQHVSLKPAEIE